MQVRLGRWMATLLRVVRPVLATGRAVSTTQVADTVYLADGTVASGSVLISWGAFTTSAGQEIAGGSTSATIAADGTFSVQLAPNAGATPVGTYYTAVYQLGDGSVTREYWVVPVSSAAVTVSAVRNTVLPTSVALQTATKSYVDAAIAAAVAGTPITGTMPFVARSGDTMTGPLVLAGDPTASLEATDKHYVDQSVANVASGLAGSVSMTPQATQAVAQPAGTQLATNRLNGSEYASQFVSGRGNNGIAGALATGDCTSGCDVKVEPTYSLQESYSTPNLPSGATAGTHVEDLRGGEKRESYMNPVDTLLSGNDAADVIDVVSTRSAASVFQQTNAEEPSSEAVLINHRGLAGGSNLFPQSIEAYFPYFKSSYSALSVNGSYNTMGQHILQPNAINCYGVGDCLMGSQILTASGGFRDEADEGAHPFDLQVREDSQVFQGTCSAGCNAGSHVVTVATTSGAGTQGEGRFLIDKAPAKMLTAGVLTGGSIGAIGAPGATATFSGTTFPVSVFLATSQVIASQANNMAPGTVTVAIASSGAPLGFATSTAALPGASGVACVADAVTASNPTNYEVVPYTVTDTTHVQMTFNKLHNTGATLAFGGLCGYGLEQTVDTSAGIRQVFPVIGSYSGTGVYYAAGLVPLVGTSGLSSAFLNLNAPVASVTRSGGVVTVTTVSALPVDINGLTLTVSGVADPSYNGSFAVTSTGPNSLTYAGSGANGTSSGGTYPFAVGAADVQTVSAAIRNEISLRGVATSPQAVQLATPQLHAVGDSITYGRGVSTAWPALLSLTNQPAYTLTNWGIVGVTMQAIDGSDPNRVATRCQSSAGPTVAVVFAGTNDFGAGYGAPASQVFSYMMGEVSTLKAAGCRVFVGTMLSRGGTDASGSSSFDADKDAYDALIMEQAGSMGADGVIDFAANAQLGADGAYADSYFQSDQVHPTQAGQALMATAASNALNYAFGYSMLNPHTVTSMPYSMTAGDGEVSLAGVSGAGALTLPDCTGQSGAVYRISNPQSAYAVTVGPLNANQLINGLAFGTTTTVPANGTLVMRDVPNPKSVSGCHWEM